jgi:hypothetical protein
MSPPRYAQHHETLVAAVTQLAMGQSAFRQAKTLAKDLSIDPSEVATVLNDFKGLFKKSAGSQKDPEGQSYCLHLRYTLRYNQDEKAERPPLDTQYLMALLEFISRKSSEESQRSVAMRAALITAGLSLLASTISLAVTLFRAA